MEQEEGNIVREYKEHLDLIQTTGDKMPSTIIIQKIQGIKLKYIIAIQMKRLNGDVSLTLICLYLAIQLCTVKIHPHQGIFIRIH